MRKYSERSVETVYSTASMNIIFDVGNVILSFNPRLYLDQTFSDPAKTEIIIKEIFNSSEWIELDKGNVDLSHAINIFSARMPLLQSEVFQVMNEWCKILTPIPSTLKIIDSLSLPLYYLSNMPRQAAHYIVKTYDFWGKFRGGIFSHTEGMVKPNPKIYEQLCVKWGLSPQECIFVDDSPTNIEAAIKLGMYGLLYSSPQQLQHDIMRYTL